MKMVIRVLGVAVFAWGLAFMACGNDSDNTPGADTAGPGEDTSGPGGDTTEPEPDGAGESAYMARLAAAPVIDGDLVAFAAIPGTITGLAENLLE